MNSSSGLRERATFPIMTTYAGGYANHVEDTVTIHCNTVIAAAGVYRTAESRLFNLVLPHPLSAIAAGSRGILNSEGSS